MELLRTNSNDDAPHRPRCRVCVHPERDRLNRALVLREMSGADVAREIGVHRSSVSRHYQRHLAPMLAAEVAVDPELSPEAIVAMMKDLHQRTRTGTAAAVDDGDLRLARSFMQDEGTMLDRWIKLHMIESDRPRGFVDSASVSEERAREIRAQLDSRIDEMAARREQLPDQGDFNDA